jgi:hypothetical protein
VVGPEGSGCAQGIDKDGHPSNYSVPEAMQYLVPGRVLEVPSIRQPQSMSVFECHGSD